ncbi:MAG: matrixin family metalloprotease [Gemmatimonadota bacterium]|jgi:hypothetical protein
MSPHTFRRTSPSTLIALVLLVGGLIAVLRARATSVTPSCAPADDPGCVAPNGTDPQAPTGSRANGPGDGPVLRASRICSDAGYLCAELSGADDVVVRRWTRSDGTLVVHVPLPPMDDDAVARVLQRAATAGVRVWNNHPFPILVDERGTRQADVEIRWTPALPATRLGVTHTEWSPATGLKVRSIELVTRSPGTGRAVDPRQIRLTAAHEMGHALGLPHSDDPRDLMYPENTATSLTAQDFRTLEVLYELDDGTRIVP